MSDGSVAYLLEHLIFVPKFALWIYRETRTKGKGQRTRITIPRQDTNLTRSVVSEITVKEEETKDVEETQPLLVVVVFWCISSTPAHKAAPGHIS